MGFGEQIGGSILSPLYATFPHPHFFNGGLAAQENRSGFFLWHFPFSLPPPAPSPPPRITVMNTCFL